KVIPSFFGILNQTFFFKNIQNSNAGGAGQMVSAKSGTQHSRPGFYFGLNECPANRKTVSHSFCNSDDVWFNFSVLVGKKLSAAPVTRLDFIQNKQTSVLFSQFFQPIQKMYVRNIDSANALNAFDNYCGNLAGFQFVLSGLQIV